jgi:hypothetical protein
MENAIIVRGKLIDDRHIELDEPIDELSGPVEIMVREAPGEPRSTDVDGLLRIEEEWRAKNRDKLRSKEEIDRYLEEERDSWERPEGWPWKREP